MIHLICNMEKRPLCHVRTAKVQMSERIHAVWYWHSLFIDIYYSIHWFCMRTTKVQINLRKCAGWSGLALSANCIRTLFMHCASFVTSCWVLNKFQLNHSLGRFSTQQIDVIFLILTRKKALAFHANCLQRRLFAWNVKAYFGGKNKKNKNCYLLKFWPSMLIVNDARYIMRNPALCLVPNNTFFPLKKYWYFSYFSTKTNLWDSRSNSLRCF